ncbi:hypothetical protein GALL_449950 [mine drainage metagenome]|uniref:Uncharacterized protein n=1 Tax=mine drainage metagenome TaxID=410659 RepID=A0A1J5Q7C6_9ZZZZ
MRHGVIHRFGGEDDVDVRNIIQFSGAALSHRQNCEPYFIGTRHLTLGNQKRGIEGIGGQIGKGCRGGFNTPLTCQILRRYLKQLTSIVQPQFIECGALFHIGELFGNQFWKAPLHRHQLAG